MHEQAILVEQAAAAAFADLCQAAPRELATTLGLQTRVLGSAIVARAAGWNTIHVNRVLGLGIVQPATQALLDQVTDFYRADNLHFAVNLSPAAQPPELPSWLEDRGFVHESNAVIVVRSMDPPEASYANLHVRQIHRAEAATLAHVLIMAFPLPKFVAAWIAATVGRPCWRHYLAFDNDVPIAAASMFIHEHVAVLNWSATRAEYRRRGAQRALINQRIRDAIQLHCTLLASDTEEDTVDEPSWSYRNLQRAGFKLLYLRPTYVSPPAT